MDHLTYNIDGTPMPPAYNNYENMAYSLKNCKVSLKNAELWKRFHALDTEMIITKSGRRMFPSLQVQVGEIDPQGFYCVFLEMVPISRCRYKYSSTGGWAPAGSVEVQSPHTLYLHPESPAKGEYWMSQPINFGRLKLTNMPAPPTGQIVLSSMHKYQPRIIIVQTTDPRSISYSPNTCVEFAETQFIAVTAYQNEKITQLKIDNNPFAKGFRQNGQAKCKRKRGCTEEKEELICVKDEQDDTEEIDVVTNKEPVLSRVSEESDDNTKSSTTQALSPRSRFSSEGDQEPLCSPSSSSSTFTESQPNKYVKSEQNNISRNTPNEYHQVSSESFGSAFSSYATNPPAFLPPASYFPASFMPALHSPPYFYPYVGFYGRNPDEMAPSRHWYPTTPRREVGRKYPKKWTDFSIEAILSS